MTKKASTINKIYAFMATIVAIFTLYPGQPALAQVMINEDYKPGFAVDLKKPEEGESTGFATRAAATILQLLAGSLIFVAGPAAVLILAVGGLRYVISHGDQTAIEEAKKTIIWAIIGLIVIMLSWAIVVNVATLLQSAGSAGS